MVEVENKVQRYEKYKDSGVEWLGEIPEHWQVEKGKWLFKKEKRSIREEDGIVTCFRDGEVTLRSNRRTDGFTNAVQEHGYQGIRKGDLVIHAMDAFAGAIGVSDSEGKSTPVYSVCTERFNNTVNSYYFAYFMRDLALSGFIVSLAKGIRERSTDFRFNDFSELLLSLPPLSEQTKIAQFLDDKTTKIDEAIAIKEQQINLLKERKQILIHKAVTRGLDDSVPLKDSGVEWIGEIPEHWEVKRLKNVCFINRNSLPETTNKDLRFRYVDIGSVSLENGIVETEEFLFKSSPSRARRIAKPGDTVISTVRTYLKAIDFVNEEKSKYIYSTGFAVLEPESFIYPEFLANFVRSDAFTEQVTINSKGMSYPAINSTDLSRLFVVHSSISEQKEISEYIETASQKIETAIGLKQQEIEKLKEYKSSLINEVVTGKVRVC